MVRKYNRRSGAKPLTKEEVLRKMMSFCTYRDRSEKEVAEKLRTFGLPPEENEWVMDMLKKENFLNQQRYIENFIYGKFFLKKWGKKKIAYQLRRQNIPSDQIEAALHSIDDQTYAEIIRKLIRLKLADYAETDREKLTAKIYRYLENKGYAAEDFYTILKDEIRKAFTA